VSPFFLVVALILMLGVRRGEAATQEDNAQITAMKAIKIEVPD
jgi:hypothetical protein